MPNQAPSVLCEESKTFDLVFIKLTCILELAYIIWRGKTQEIDSALCHRSLRTTKRKQACASAQSDQSIWPSRIRKYHIFLSFILSSYTLAIKYLIIIRGESNI